MSKRSSIVHIEWRSKNVAKLKEFYKNAFRWKFDESMPGYALANAGNSEVGVGIMQIEAGSPHSQGVVAFLESDDLGASESAIREAGGQIVGSPQEVPGWGRFSVFTDPDGNPVGLWQSEASLKKEEKKLKKADKKRARAAEEAAPPSDGAAPKKKADKAARKAEERAHKLEKKAQKLAAKAEKRAHKLEKKAALKAERKSDAPDEPKNKDKKPKNPKNPKNKDKKKSKDADLAQQ